jgi:uncharacterized protein involved in type VI secretion and phage assembly
MTSLEVIDLERAATGPGGRFYGLYPAVVTDNQDPDNQGRVRIRLPWSPDNDGAAYENWARLATMMAGNNRGSWFIPDVDDEVLVGFEAGDPRRPYVVGMLWNGRDNPPEQMDSDNNLKTILSRAGIGITMDDTDGAVKLTLSTPGGHSLVFNDSNLSITATDTTGNTIKMDTGGISISAVAKVKVDAPLIQASAGMVTVDAALSLFSGVVQCDTLISNAVISTSYTPGIGNLW